MGASKLQTRKEGTIVVDVYFHVYFNSFGTGFLTDDTIQKQMNVLNKAFSGITSSYNACGFNYEEFPTSPFVFNLVEVIRSMDNDAFNVDSVQSRIIRENTRRGSCADLNIYSGRSMFLGYATFPFQCAPAGNEDPTIVSRGDSVVIDYGSVPEGNTNFFNEGDTLVHEVGHWLGLFHTFEGGCTGNGDFVDDTPPEASPHYGCSIGRDSCSGGGVDPIFNFMDYSDDCCMYLFTQGQIDTMVDLAGTYRNLEPNSFLPSSSPSKPPTGSPTISVAPTVSSFPSAIPSSSAEPSTSPSLLPTTSPSSLPTTSSPTLAPTTLLDVFFDILEDIRDTLNGFLDDLLSLIPFI